VERLPVRAWIFYVVFCFVLILVQILILWLDGGLQAEEILPVVIFNGWATPFLLALIHLFDSQAATALGSMRSSLDMTVPEFEECRYKMSNMPVFAPLAAGLTLLVLVILMEQFSAVPSSYAVLEQLPIFAVVFQIIDKSSAFMYGVMVYHTVRQLRFVTIINSSHLRVSLFNVWPSQAFSRLTASTAVGLTVGVFAWLLINPELLASPVSVAFTAAFTLLAVAVFVWPLLGAHRLMETEKAKMLQEIDGHFEDAFSEFNQRLCDGDFSASERLHETISSLEIQHRRIAAIPTWPWKPEIARVALTAIALPLILMIIQYFVLQALDG
jgi:hypothetical protein